MTLQHWSDQVCQTLGIGLTPDLKQILDTARDVAHTVERPAAPVTAFLTGYAAALRGGSAEDVTAVTEEIERLVAGWQSTESNHDS